MQIKRVELKELRGFVKKIYLAGINANQLINPEGGNTKYTEIDTTILTSCLCIKHFADTDTLSKEAINCVMKNFIDSISYSQIGNISFLLKNETTKSIGEELIKEAIDEINSTSSLLEIDTSLKYSKKYQLIWDFYAEYSKAMLYMRLYLEGNVFAFDSCILQMTKMQRYSIDSWLPGIEKIMLLKDNICFTVNALTQYSGQKLLKVLKKENCEFAFANIIFQLKNCNRFSQVVNFSKEDMLIHTYLATMCGISLTKYLNTCGDNIDIQKVFLKILFHEFPAYTGEELLFSVKGYNEEVEKIARKKELEKIENIKSVVGDDIFGYISGYKKEATGYIAEITDKIVGLMKPYVEVHLFGNINFLPLFNIDFKRLEKSFSDDTRVSNLKNNMLLYSLLRYIYITNIRYIEHYHQKSMKKFFSDLTLAKLEHLYILLENEWSSNN